MELDKKRIQTISEEFSLALPTASKYIHMTEEEIIALDTPANHKKRSTIMDDYLNIIYKMLCDNRDPADIMSYVIRAGYGGNRNSLEQYIQLLAKNNFNIQIKRDYAYTFKYPEDVVVIKRRELLKYITTKNSKVKKDETIAQYLDVVKKKYEIVTALESAYNDFYEILMGDSPEKLDDFILKYEKSEISGFVEGIKRDIAPVKNAISHDESSGFVEGNNNKFKLIKRILYGRSNLVNLFKKCYLAFQVKSKDFDLLKLTQKDTS